MEFDTFFSISQTPVHGALLPEAVLFRSFFDQVQAADRLGFGTAWVAEAHLSTEVQKRHPRPVVPHWQGEIGLNTDILLLAQAVFQRTSRIAVGSAITNLLVNGGPVAHAERVAAFMSLHGLDPKEQRRLRLGFSAGRFDFMNRAHGVGPRNPVEEVLWPVLKGQVFAQACALFLRLLRGEEVAGAELPPYRIARSALRTEAERLTLDEVLRAAGRASSEEVAIPSFWPFEVLRIVPREWRRELLELYLGSHEPHLQSACNAYLPVRVFNLSITPPAVIEETHSRMARDFHPEGGAWKRANMPRTLMVFLNAQPGISADERRRRAQAEANLALAAYWTALEGTLDPKKVEQASANAVVGDPETVAEQIATRFHPDDRLMLWFDFFRDSSERIVEDMEAFMGEVVPRLG
jgi:alkanesulfonate monooxygenase SsuD/methylene tetrahydromethanopterin reductase-like flavin-dependent oxidoreductase (luciferase family)